MVDRGGRMGCPRGMKLILMFPILALFGACWSSPASIAKSEVSAGTTTSAKFSGTIELPSHPPAKWSTYESTRVEGPFVITMMEGIWFYRKNTPPGDGGRELNLVPGQQFFVPEGHHVIQKSKDSQWVSGFRPEQ